MISSSDSELERKNRKAKKALEDLAAAAGFLRGNELKLNVNHRSRKTQASNWGPLFDQNRIGTPSSTISDDGLHHFTCGWVPFPSVDYRSSRQAVSVYKHVDELVRLE
jgi:hypothetical protein